MQKIDLMVTLVVSSVKLVGVPWSIAAREALRDGTADSEQQQVLSAILEGLVEVMLIDAR
jgi:hypothetical protein